MLVALIIGNALGPLGSTVRWILITPRLATLRPTSIASEPTK